MFLKVFLLSYAAGVGICHEVLEHFGLMIGRGKKSLNCS